MRVDETKVVMQLHKPYIGIYMTTPSKLRTTCTQMSFFSFGHTAPTIFLQILYECAIFEPQPISDVHIDEDSAAKYWLST